MFDFAHKLTHPETYSCGLCLLTHSNFGERQEWSSFLKETKLTIDFHHIEDFEDTYNQKHTYPVIFIKTKDLLTVLYDHKQIASFENVSELISSVNASRISEVNNLKDQNHLP
jgi:hypothetical protein